MSSQRLRLATRTSALATAQATAAKALLEQSVPGLEVELKPVVSEGDQITGSLADSGGKELFVNRLREAMLAGEADCACHSLKDVGPDRSEFELAAFLPRADPRDALIGSTLAGLAAMAQPVVATSSPRRAGQLSCALPHARVVEMRGNIDTRLAKLAASEADALMLACAGLGRLGLDSHIAERLDTDMFVPAPGQGIVVLECLSEARDVAQTLAAVDDPASRLQALAERACARKIGGDCHTPLGALACAADSGVIKVSCKLAHAGQVATASAEGRDPVATGACAAESMLASGGGKIVRLLRHE